MNSCFEKFLGFKRIMSDGLGLFLILSKLFKSMYFFLISSNYMNTGVTFNVLGKNKRKIRKKIMGKDNEANPRQGNYLG